MSLTGPNPSQPAAASSESAEMITTAMASAAPSSPVSALETIARPGGISTSGGVAGLSVSAVAAPAAPAASAAFAVRAATSALAASASLSFLGWVASSMAPVPGSPISIPSNGSLSAVLKPPSMTCSPDLEGGSGGGASRAGGGLDFASAAASFAADGLTSSSRSMLSKFGIGFALTAGFDAFGVRRGLAAGASPVSSAMPKRSSVSTRLPLPAVGGLERAGG